VFVEILKTDIKGCYKLTRKPFRDERGQFARMFDMNELKDVGINFNIVNVNYSSNKEKGVLRGLHSQTGEFAEDKLVACVNGEILDVCVDVNENSPTYGKFVSAVLSEENDTMLLVPKGCAHGYLALTENTKIIYFVTQFYSGPSEKGYMYNDPFFDINWEDFLPPPYILSEKDKKHNLITKRETL
jgi:dTDP-4-dehydrorhamnose 3,5-epimerase